MKQKQQMAAGAIIMMGMIGLGIVTSGSEPMDNPREVNRKALLMQMAQEGLSKDNCYLNGRLIGQGVWRYVAWPYPAEGFPHDWSFNDGSFCGLNGIHGLENVRVEDGIFKFTTTTNDPYFGWGNFDPKLPGLRIGYGAFPRLIIGRMDYIRVRMKQSQPVSVVQASFKNLKAVFFSKETTVTGTVWQTVELSMPPKPSPFTGVRILFKSPGDNQVEIDWVHPCTIGPPCQYRKVIEIPDEVRWAKCSVSTYERFNFYINGRLAIESPPKVLREQMYDYEIDPQLFRKGKNLIAFENTAWYMGSFVLDGALLCRDGTYLRFDSDESWKANSGQEGRSWVNVEYDDSEWKPALPLEKIDNKAHQPEEEWNKFWFNPSWKGRLSVRPADKRSEPVYGSKDDVKLSVQVPMKEGEKHEMTYQVFDEMGDGFHAADKLVKEGNLELQRSEVSGQGSENQKSEIRNPKSPDYVGTLRFSAGELPYNRAYAVVFHLKLNGEEVEKYRYEIAVCGPIGQPAVVNPTNYTDGMELKLVWENDAAAPQKEGLASEALGQRNISTSNTLAKKAGEVGWAKEAEYISCDGKGNPRESPVITNELGKFRLVGTGDYPVAAAYISFKYEIQNPGRPHLAVAEYPSDTPRIQEMRLQETCPEMAERYAPMGVTQLGNNTVNIGIENPLTRKIENHTVVFFPNRKAGTVSFFTIRGRGREAKYSARVGKIWIYEILNDIPMRRITDAPGPKRWTGQQSEAGPRQIMQSCLASPIANLYRNMFPATDTPNFYRNWLVTYINLIKRLRFAGDNAYYSGQYMYGGTLFPTELTYGTEFSWGSNGTLRDYGVLMSKLFEENDMGWFSSLEIVDLLGVFRQGSDDDVARGMPTLGQVDKYGKQHGGFGTANLDLPTILPNWIHPEVRPKFNRIISDLIALYGKQSGWNGISLYLDQLNGPGWTGGPYLESDPLGGSYDDYTIALFEKETGINIPVGKNDPNRFNKRYLWLLANARKEWIQWRCEKMTEIYEWMRDSLKQVRPDLKLVLNTGVPHVPDGQELPPPGKPIYDYAREWGFDIEKMKNDPGIVLAVSVTGQRDINKWVNNSSSTLGRFRARTRELLAPFADDGINGVAVRYGWNEPDVTGPKGWIWENSETEAYMRPETDFLRDYFVNVFVRMNPVLIINPLTDYVLWIGREHDISRFNQAIRSIPVAAYTRLVGAGRDKNIWIETARLGDAIYGYAANAQWWDMEADVVFADGVQVFDLIAQEPVKGQTWKIRLKPYDIRTFRAMGGASADIVKSCTVAVSDQAEPEIRKSLAEVEAGFKEHEALLKAGGADQRVRGLLGQVRKALADQDFSAAYDLLATSEIPLKLRQMSWKDPAWKPKTVRAQKRTGAIALNGNLDDWPKTDAAVLDQKAQVFKSKDPEWAGPDDYSGKVRMLWDEDALYVSFDVTDHTQYFSEGIWLWNGDSVEVYFDTDVAADFGEAEYSPDDTKITLAVPTDIRDKLRFYQRIGTQIDTLTDGMQGAFKVGKDGYIIEAKIPWRLIRKDPVCAGLEMGFDVKLIDFTKLQHHRQNMLWSSYQKQIENDPRTFGRMKLEE